MLKDCPHPKENSRGLRNLEATVTMEEMAREAPQIYAMSDNHQADHQSQQWKLEVRLLRNPFLF